MRDKTKTKEQLIEELVEPRQCIAELERSEDERKQLEALLLRERDTFVTILEHALYGVVLLDRDGKHVFVNPAFTAITGYAIEDIPTGKDWMHKAYPNKAYRQEVTELWRKDSKVGGTKRVISVVCKNGETKEIEFRPTILKDGRAVVMSADVTERERAEEALQRHQEDLEKLVTERTASLQAANAKLQREITERKQMEEALRESEERFRKVVETMKVGLGSIDESGVLTYVNEYLAKMLGYSIDEMIGRSTLDFYYDEESRQVQKEIFKKRKAGMRDPTPYEVTWRRRDGQKVYSILSPTPLFDAHGHYAGSFAIHTDITKRKRMEEALRESEEKYRELINGMNDTAWVIDFNGKFIDVNNAAVEVLGYSREELLSMGPHDIDNTLDAEEIRALIKEMPADKIQVFETTHTAKDGKVIPVEIKSSLVTYQGKRAILSIARDITERRRAEEALRESESRFRLLVEHSKDSFVLHDLDGKIIDVNQHACDSLGYTREELLSLSVQDIDQKAIIEKHAEKWPQMILGEPITLEGVDKRKDGTTFPVEIRLVAFESGGRRLILGLIRNISDRKRAEETIRKLAYHDALTGLPNRVLFADRLNRAMARAHRSRKKFVVMSLDLDHFKDINDTLGHAVGDQLLFSVGKRLTRLLRQEDTVSRMGGDEFFLLLPEVNRAQDAATIAQKVLKAFQEPFVLDDQEISITTSIGVAIYPDEGEDVTTLLRNADVALYQAKQEGRNNYQRCTAAMKENFRER